MLQSTALPIIGMAYCNAAMLQGKTLADALMAAMAKKRDSDPGFGPTRLAQGLGISQPSASELLKTGRLSKARYPKLVGIFEDVVGPEHWGLPPRTDLSAEALQLAADFDAKIPPQLRELAYARLAGAINKMLDDLKAAIVAPTSGPASPPTSPRPAGKKKLLS